MHWGVAYVQTNPYFWGHIMGLSKSRLDLVVHLFIDPFDPQIGTTMDNPKKRGFFIKLCLITRVQLAGFKETEEPLDWFDGKFAGFNHHWKGYHVFDFRYVLESEKDPSEIQRYRVYLQEGVGA